MSLGRTSLHGYCGTRKATDRPSPPDCGGTGFGARRKGVTSLEGCVARCRACGADRCRYATYSQRVGGGDCSLYVSCDSSRLPQAHGGYQTVDVLQALATTASPLDDCCYDEQLTVVQMPASAAAKWRLSPASTRGSSRYVTSNHKTGTFLAACIVQVAQRHAVRVAFAQDSANGGMERMSVHDAQGSKLASGLNMVRSPVVLVESGYNYHLQTSEPWANTPLGSWRGISVPMAAGPALETWRRWRSHHPGKVPISNATTYRAVLLHLEQGEGLLLESLRALWATVPFILNSARSCAVAGSACANADLEQVMKNYSAAWDQTIAPALRFEIKDLGEDTARGMRDDFLRECDPGAWPTVPTRGPKHPLRHIAHNTTLASREQRLALIRHFDQQYLGSALANAEDELRRVLM